MDSPATSPAHQPYGAIFLSPHLDDAVLSCGGTIHLLTQAGKPVLVVSVTAGDPPAGELSPFAKNLHARWRLAADSVASRRTEDVEACVDLGADWLHWQIPDCIYRRNIVNGKPLYDREEALFGAIDPSEMDFVANLSQHLESLPSSDSVYVPLAAGNHVDHQLARLAAEKWLEPTSFLYYEEFPYSQAENQLATALGDDGRWRADVIRLEPANVEARIHAIACYRSQISTFFTDLEDLSAQVYQYIQKVGGERYWKRAH
ncbi:MAG: PIG-L family deacetylase [Candidatus Promineifilaceae bacterium]